MVGKKEGSAVSDLESATCYSEWRNAAMAYDVKLKSDKWKLQDKTRRYDYIAIRNRLDTLRKLRNSKDDSGLLFILNEGIHGNMGRMGNHSLYQKSKFGTKNLVTEYVEETASALHYLANSDSGAFSVGEKFEFFHRASHCYGRSALMMSGAGSLLYFHLGVVKALWEQNILPSIISGASGGAFVAALVGTHTNDQLAQIFDPAFLKLEVEKDVGFIRNFALFKSGPMPVDEMRSVYERLIPDMTFQEAFHLTGYQINISVSPAERHQTSRLLNAITSPNVLIRDAVIASCSVPGIYPPAALAAKNAQGLKQAYLPGRRWVDGSMAEDLPIKRLVRLYGVNHTIASQTNPLVLPFIAEHKEQEAVNDVLKGAVLTSAKHWALTTAKLFKAPINRVSMLSKLVNTWVSLLSQTYTGDINILPPNRLFNPIRLMQFRSNAEILSMIRDGERAAWPKIEKIRIQSLVSRALEEITQCMDKDLFNESESKCKH